MPGSVGILRSLVVLLLMIVTTGCDQRTRLKYKAQLGGREAKREYGKWICAFGRDNEYPEGIRWLTKAAEAGDVKAMYELGLVYDGTPPAGSPYPPFERSLYWFRKGAEAGDRFCMIQLADGYRYGRLGLPKDPVEAERWFAMASKAKKPGES